MNYNAFQTYLEIFRLDEVKVIGKDVMLDDVCIHIVGMGLRKECHNKGAFLYILEEQPLQEKYTSSRNIQTKGNPCWNLVVQIKKAAGHCISGK